MSDKPEVEPWLNPERDWQSKWSAARQEIERLRALLRNVAPCPEWLTVMSGKPEAAWKCDDCGAVCLHARSVHHCDPEELVAHWAVQQTKLGRKLVALIPPTEAHDGPRYAGYYCVDGPEPVKAR